MSTQADSYRRRTTRGFTLIELLVVVSIILLMVAIILPSINHATYNAKVVTCQAQLRQWGYSFLNYASDYTRHMPRYDIPGGGQEGYLWDIGTKDPDGDGKIGHHDTDGEAPGNFFLDIVSYGLPWDHWICPVKGAGDKQYLYEMSVEEAIGTYPNKFHYARHGHMAAGSGINRNIWVPRLSQGANEDYWRNWTPFAPYAKANDGNYPYLDEPRGSGNYPNKWIAAPSRLSDAHRYDNPVVTDSNSQGRGKDYVNGTHEYGKYQSGPLKGRDKIHSTSRLYVDGHVKLLLGTEDLRMRHRAHRGWRWSTWY